jgi:hypothetical protein
MKQSSTRVVRGRVPIAAGAVVAWVAISPWVWGFAASPSAVANHVFFVFAFGPLAAMIAVLRPAAVVTTLGGLWLAFSPWVLGYAGDHAAWLSELVAGVLLVVLGGSAAGIGAALRPRLRDARRRRTGAGGAATFGPVRSDQ